MPMLLVHPSPSNPRKTRYRFPVAMVAIAALATVAGCPHDPRVSLNEFIAMRDMMMHPPEPASQPASTAASVISDRALPPYRIGPGDTLAVTLIGINGGTDTVLVHVHVTRDG